MAGLLTEKRSGTGNLKLNPIGQLFSGTEYVINLKVCADPICNCGAANIEIIKAENLGTSDIEYNLPIDVHEEVVRSQYNKEFYSKAKNGGYLAALFSNSLTQEDWRSLREEYFDNKFILTDWLNPDEIEFEFEEEDYRDISLMFSYPDAFPCSIFTQEVNGKKYVLLDTYCKNPNCHCCNMLLAIYEFSEEKNKGLKTTKTIGTYHYNYKTDKARIEGKDRITVETVVQQVFQKHAEINKLFRRRNQVIRKLYSKSKKKYNMEVEQGLKPLEKKIGRNELCPCGSGKKYKKCCLK